MKDPQQFASENLPEKPTGRPIQFSKAKVGVLSKGGTKMAKPSNMHNKPKFSRVTHQKLSSVAKAAPAFKSPMPPSKQPTKSKLGEKNQ